MDVTYKRALAVLNQQGIAPEQVRQMSQSELIRLPDMGKESIRKLRQYHPARARVILETDADVELVRALVERLGGRLEKDD